MNKPVMWLALAVLLLTAEPGVIPRLILSPLHLVGYFIVVMILLRELDR